MQPMIVSGTVINRRYQIQKKIKDNTSNCCYLAEDADQSNRLVLISFPRIELLILPGFANAFQDACNSLANLRINSLAMVLDNGLYESQPYVVLQNINQESLETVLRHSKESGQESAIDSVLDWAAPLAVILDELHDADYIHGNIRPDSVYLSSKQLLLGDFATEFALQRMGKFKSAVSTLDVNNYLAPEFLKSHYSPAYDQYLLATLIYEALANKAPFSDARTGEEYRMQVATLVAEPLKTHRPELDEVSDALAKALERNPTNRFNSCRELISQIQMTQGTSTNVAQLRPAVKDVPDAIPPEPVFDEPAMASAYYDEGDGKSKRGLIWGGGILLGMAVVAYTVVSQNGADQITSNPAKAQAATSSITAKTARIEPSLAQQVGAAVGESSVELPVPAATSKMGMLDTMNLKAMIEEEALLAHQEMASEKPNDAEEASDQAVEVDLPAKTESSTGQQQTRQAQDFTGLTDAISQAVNAGQKEFIESQDQNADNPDARGQTPVDVAAITDQVSAAVQGAEETQAAEALAARQAEQERLNQELLAAEALVRKREEEQKRAQERAAEIQQASSQAQADQTADSVADDASEEASPQSDAQDQTAVAELDNDTGGSSQTALTERQRIRAFKEKELARIKAVTSGCVTGGKVHREAAAGNLSFVKSCMAVGVDPNLAQSDGWTLLHIASRSGHLNMSKLLIAKGARVNAKSAEGLTALDMAITQRQSKVVNYLKRRGGLTSR